MTTSQTAPARIGAAIGRLLDNDATEYVYDWTDRLTEKLDAKQGEPAFVIVLQRIQDWFNQNVPPAAPATVGDCTDCEKALQSGTWLCEPNSGS